MKPPAISSVILPLILSAYAALALLQAAAAPLWGGHEADYYTVARFLVERGRLPTAEDYPAGDAEVRQATQPPLYFFLIAPLITLFDDGQPVPPGVHPVTICPGGDAEVGRTILYPPTEAYTFPPQGAALAGYAIRILGIALGLGAIAATYHLGRALFPDNRWIALGAAALLACEPNTLRMTVTISNDGLLLLIAAINLLALARLRASRTPWPLIVVALTGALAVLTRLQGWAVLALDALIVLGWIGTRLWRRRRAARRAWIAALAALGALLLAGGALAVFNLTQYGSLFGRYELLDRLVADAVRTGRGLLVAPQTLIGIINHTRLSFLEPLTDLTSSRWLALFYTAIPTALIASALIAALRALLRRRDRSAFTLLALSAALAWGLVIFRTALFSGAGNTTFYNTTFIFAPVRYYAPALPAAAVLFAAGLAGTLDLLPARLRRAPLLSGALLLIALIWGSVALLDGLRAADRPTLALIDPTDLPAEAIRVSDETVDTVDLLAYELTPHPQAGRVDVTLYARALRPVNAVAELSLGGSPCQVLPARGHVPTARWPADRAAIMQFSIPYCGTPQRDPHLTLTWMIADADGMPVSRGAALDLGPVPGDFRAAASCPPLFGAVGGFQATGFNSPPSVRLGETYLPSVNWIVFAANPALSGRLFVFEHVDSGARYGCTDLTHARTPAQWLTGEYVYFDGCPFVFPADAPTGPYTVYVGLLGRDGALLPAQSADGAPLAEGLIAVGSVTVLP